MKDFIISESKNEQAVLVGLITQYQTEEQVKEYLDELAFLAETASIVPVKKFTQKLEKANPVTFVGTGKLQEIKQYMEDNEIGLVIFDDELSAMNFWGEVGVTLMYIEPGDVPEDIKRHVLDVIHHLIANPEFVVHLTDEYYLMLSITEDNGNGIYLLFHPECPLKGIDTLMSMAESRL